MDVIFTTALEGNRETAALARTHGHMDGRSGEVHIRTNTARSLNLIPINVSFE